LQLLSAFADISLAQLVLVAAMALVASVVGGVSGYGTGALMPLVLVPIVGAERVVPIIAISSLFTNASRTVAFFAVIDPRRAVIVLAGAIPTCVLGAWGFTKLDDEGALLVIGTMMTVSVPLRRLLKRREIRLSEGGLLAGALGFGLAAGGTAGAGIILLSLLMAVGLESSAVIATDAAVSIVLGIVRVLVFGVAGAIDAQVFAFALLIGLVAFPGAFLAKTFVERLPVPVHTAILDAVVLIGGVSMIIGAFTR
jgi:uncharacterized membrane protein YfcA